MDVACAPALKLPENAPLTPAAAEVTVSCVVLRTSEVVEARPPESFFAACWDDIVEVRRGEVWLSVRQLSHLSDSWIVDDEGLHVRWSLEVHSTLTTYAHAGTLTQACMKPRYPKPVFEFSFSQGVTCSIQRQSSTATRAVQRGSSQLGRSSSVIETTKDLDYTGTSLPQSSARRQRQ